jgi:lactoylglutathione lyase
MRLAKPSFDVGLMTRDGAAARSFWSEAAGLRLDHVLDVENGRSQFRYDVHGSVVKVNHFPHMPPSAPADGGYVALECADAAGVGAWLTGPDRTLFRRVPRIANGRADVRVVLHTVDVERLWRFYVRVLEFEPLSESEVLCGRSALQFEKRPGLRSEPALEGSGYRYLTVQIFDADRAHRHVLAAGGMEGMPPTNLRDVARFSFVRDPDGNWIELSARASLIGDTTREHTG